jgi:hypothetical protein
LLAESAIISVEDRRTSACARSDGETLDNDDVADEEKILSVCCGLVVTDTESQIIRLVCEYAFGLVCK